MKSNEDATGVPLPDLGDGTADAELSRYFVKAGQTVAVGTPLAEVVTDKVSVEIESPVAGIVRSLRVKEGAEPVLAPVAHPKEAGTMKATDSDPEKLDAQAVVIGGGPGGYVCAIRLAQLRRDKPLSISRSAALALTALVLLPAAPALAAGGVPGQSAPPAFAGVPGPLAMGPAGMAPMMMGHMMMGGDHMGGTAHGWSAGAEFRYLPGLPIVTPTTTVVAGQGPATVVGGFDVRHDMGMMGLGAQANVAAQLGASSGAGNWVTPHVGLLPRIGLGLGPIRIEGGVLAGLGLMLRQVANQSGASALEAKGAWVLEPRVEIGLRGDGLAGALVGTYLVSSAPTDLGGLTGGVRLSFGGSSTRERQGPDDQVERRGHSH